jgi:hypothetical protein
LAAVLVPFMKRGTPAASAGSVLIEQLLRACNPAKIVIVVLPKEGEPGLVQVEKLLSRPLYNTVRQMYGGTLNMVSRYGADPHITDTLCTPSWHLSFGRAAVG